MTRKIILAVLGVALLAGAIWVAMGLMGQRTPPRPVEQKRVVTVFTQTVQNQDIPITITTSGNLRAKNRMEVYSEVQGIFESTDKAFKPGVRYQRGEPLLTLNSDEHEANLRAQKSNLYNQIVLFIPDLRLDFPESFPKWDDYVRTFSMDALLASLPEPSSEKEKLFVSGRNVITSWYNVKNLEERLTKYTIRAPFTGVLTVALVDPGTLVRAGQKLGEFIDPSVYELEVAINTEYGEWLEVGKKVQLHNAGETRSWQGTVTRVNSMVDPTSQSIPVFVQVQGQDLKEGMYLEADVTAREEKGTFEISRKLLFDENKLFVVEDSVLSVREVIPVYFKENTVVIRGLQDGTRILTRLVPDAYAGMRVDALKES